MAKTKIFYQDNTQLVQLLGLQDEISGAFQNAATMSATLLDQNGNEVPNCIDIAMSYVAGSNGNYQGIVSAAFEPPVGGGYVLVIDADSNGAHLHVELQAQVQVRTS